MRLRWLDLLKEKLPWGGFWSITRSWSTHHKEVEEEDRGRLSHHIPSLRQASVFSTTSEGFLSICQGPFFGQGHSRRCWVCQALVTKVVVVIGVRTLKRSPIFLSSCKKILGPIFLYTKCAYYTSVYFKRCTFIPQEAGGSFEEQNREGGHCEVLGSSKPPSQPLSCVKVSQINLNR